MQLSRENISKSFTTRAELDRGIKVVLGDGRKGCSSDDVPAGGWDVIHASRISCPSIQPTDESLIFLASQVGAAAPTLPEAVLQQLKSPGRVFIPIGEETQAVWQIDKDTSGVVKKTRLFGVRYIP